MRNTTLQVWNKSHHDVLTLPRATLLILLPSILSHPPSLLHDDMTEQYYWMHTVVGVYLTIAIIIVDTYNSNIRTLYIFKVLHEVEPPPTVWDHLFTLHTCLYNYHYIHGSSQTGHDKKLTYHCCLLTGQIVVCGTGYPCAHMHRHYTQYVQTHLYKVFLCVLHLITRHVCVYVYYAYTRAHMYIK